MTPELDGKTALITGGGTGIGRASAVALSAAGCAVTVTGRTIQTLDETVDLIRAAGGMARSVQCDVTDEQSVRDAVRAASGDAGQLDFAVKIPRIRTSGLVVPTGVGHQPLADEETLLPIVGRTITSNAAGGKPAWSDKVAESVHA